MYKELQFERRTVIRGDTHSRSFDYNYRDEAGNEQPVDFNLVQDVVINIRRGEKESRTILSLTRSNGRITIQDGNVIVYELTAEETLQMKGYYQYEIQLIYNDGSKETWSNHILITE